MLIAIATMASKQSKNCYDVYYNCDKMYLLIYRYKIISYIIFKERIYDE